MEHLSLQVGKTNLDQLKTGGYALMMMLMIVVVVSVVGVVSVMIVVATVVLTF